MPDGRGECGARGRGLISSASGRLGHHACRYYDRRVRCSLDWDRRRRVTPSRPRPRKHGLGCALGDVSPFGESRGGTPAGERARERKGRRKPLLPWRDRTPFACGTDDSAFAGVPLPLFLSFVGWAERSEAHAERRGDTAMHSVGTALCAFAHPTSLDIEASRPYPHIAPLMRATDVRHRCLTTLARWSRRGNGIACIRPREAGEGDHP
jgi:hypothetical protein